MGMPCCQKENYLGYECFICLAESYFSRMHGCLFKAWNWRTVSKQILETSKFATLTSTCQNRLDEGVNFPGDVYAGEHCLRWHFTPNRLKTDKSAWAFFPLWSSRASQTHSCWNRQQRWLVDYSWQSNESLAGNNPWPTPLGATERLQRETNIHALRFNSVRDWLTVDGTQGGMIDVAVPGQTICRPSYVRGTNSKITTVLH